MIDVLRKYDVEIDYAAEKREADGLGRETPLTVDDWMQVGVFARPEGEQSEGRALYLENQHITSASGTLKLVVDGAPYEVGLDPYNKLIDRIPDDNRKTMD